MMELDQTTGTPANKAGNSGIITAVAAVGVGAALMSATRSARAVTPALTYAQIQGTGDIKVLNYALSLEYLEADLYAQAIMRLTTGGTNALGIAIPGLNLTGPDVDYITEFAVVEADHRDFLKAALGSQAMAGFKYDFNMQNRTRAQVSAVVYDAELTGVGAYLGAIPDFATKTYVPVAAAILGTEARHTAAMAIVQNILFNTNIETAPLANENNGRDTPVDPDTVLAHVSPFIVVS